ncbi:hypothetical protein EBU99_08975 [bacterium]|nr:hypothetical protein [bacterium]
MNINRTTVVLSCLLFISACNPEVKSTKGDSRSEKKIDNDSNPAPNGTTQTNTSAKHLLEPSSDTVFLSSCAKIVKAGATPTATDQSFSASGKAAGEVLVRLAGKGKVAYCAEQFIASSASDTAKALHIMDMSGTCVANDAASEAKFSRSERCPPPQTGEQFLERRTAMFEGVTFAEAYRSTFYINGATAEEKRVLKGGWSELFPSSDKAERMLTSDLK